MLFFEICNLTMIYMNKYISTLWRLSSPRILPNLELQFVKDSFLIFDVKSLILALYDAWNQNALMIQTVRGYNFTFLIYFLATC